MTLFSNGYRGYVTSRSFLEYRVPQHIQNLVIRDYCQKHGLHYLLSVTEHVMPNCYMILKQIMKEIDALEGIVMYSLFQLPESDHIRKEIYRKLLSSNRTIHTAVEGFIIKNNDDIQRMEDIWQLQKIILFGEKKRKEYNERN